MAITIKTIDQILAGTIQDSSPVMFGLGTEIFKTTWGDMKNTVANGVTDVTYRLIPYDTIVAQTAGDSFLSTINLTKPAGEITFIQFKVIYDDGSIGLNTYLVPLGEGFYTPLGSSIAFSDLILIDRVETTVEINDANTVTYTVTDLSVINSADPPYDFSNTDFVYFVNLDGALYQFIGTNGLYGLNNLQMVMADLQLVRGAETITIDSSLNEFSLNPVTNEAITQKFNTLALEKLDEGNGVGFRIEGRDPANYGNIGLNAVDLSTSTSVSNTIGATGTNSHAEGLNTTAFGPNSHAEGDNTVAGGSNDHAEGQNTVASGITSHAEGLGTKATAPRAHSEGFNTIASGTSSHAEGENTSAEGQSSHAEGDRTVASGTSSHAEGFRNFARSFAEHSGGILGTDYTPLGDKTDRIVNYGIGEEVSGSGPIRRDAFTIYKNGAVRFFRTTLASITNTIKEGMLIFDSGNANRPTIHDGTNWEGLAYKSEVDKATITIDLTEVLTLDFPASQNLRIDSVTNLNGTPTTTILVNDASYTFGNLINQGDKITVSVDVYSVINLNGTYE